MSQTQWCLQAAVWHILILVVFKAHITVWAFFLVQTALFCYRNQVLCHQKWSKQSSLLTKYSLELKIIALTTVGDFATTINRSSCKFPFHSIFSLAKRITNSYSMHETELIRTSLFSSSYYFVKSGCECVVSYVTWVPLDRLMSCLCE